MHFPRTLVIAVGEAFCRLGIEQCSVCPKHEQDWDSARQSVAKPGDQGCVAVNASALVHVHQDQHVMGIQLAGNAAIILEQAVHALTVTAPVRAETEQHPLLLHLRFCQRRRELLLALRLWVVDLRRGRVPIALGSRATIEKKSESQHA